MNNLVNPHARPMHKLLAWRAGFSLKLVTKLWKWCVFHNFTKHGCKLFTFPTVSKFVKIYLPSTTKWFCSSYLLEWCFSLGPEPDYNGKSDQRIYFTCNGGLISDSAKLCAHSSRLPLPKAIKSRHVWCIIHCCIVCCQSRSPLRCACGAKRKAAGPQCVHVTCYKPRNTLLTKGLSKGFAIWALPTDTDNIIFWLSVRGFHCCSFEFSSTQSMSRSIHKKPLLMWADRRLSFLDLTFFFSLIRCGENIFIELWNRYG